MTDQVAKRTVQNPFAVATSAATDIDAGGMQVAAAREQQQVQAQILLARQFPRDPIASMDRILDACCRPTLAEGALYSYARGGSQITGPSIRLAEAMAQSWGNMDCGVRELSNAGGESAVEAYAWDMETNTRISKTFTVKHQRDTRNGSRKLTDGRDVYELVANNAARRLRACILAVLPGDIIESAVKQCEVTQQASADVTPEGIAKMSEAFEEFGVTKDHIAKRIQRRLDTMQPAQFLTLRKIYASLKDGMSAAGDWFEGAGDTKQQASPLFEAKAEAPTIEAGTVSPPLREPATEPAPATTTAAAPQPEPVEEVSTETAEAVPTQEQKQAMKDLATKAGVIKANTWLVKVGMIKEGQSFRDMTAEQIDRCLKSPQSFLDEVAK